MSHPIAFQQTEVISALQTVLDYHFDDMREYRLLNSHERLQCCHIGESLVVLEDYMMYVKSLCQQILCEIDGVDTIISTQDDGL